MDERDFPGVERPASIQPIPQDAVVVFAGEIFEILRWKQVLFDGSKKTFEKVRRPDTALVLPVVSGSLRISRQQQPGCRAPFFGLIGGRVERGEHPAEAARRELLEEASLVPRSLDLWVAFQPLAKIEWSVFVFVAKNCTSSDASTPDPGEIIELVDVSLEELIALAGAESFRDVGVALHLLRIAADPAQLDNARAYLGL
jgi:8-oxo-dGTP pyrophosphatase MutT (NUDIX family)